MKKWRWKFLCWMILLIMVFAMGCSKPAQQPEQAVQEEPQEKKLIVYASFYPMYDFAHKIGGEKIDLRLMVPPGVEVHDWEPTAKLMGEIEKADILIYNGLQMEPWVEKMIASVSSDKLKVVEASQGVTLLKAEEHEHEGEEAHEHDHEGEEAHDHEGEEDHKKGENHGEAHQHGEYDPHVWLNPINAMKQAENIKNALVAADEANKDFYEENYQKFSQELMALDAKFKEELSNRKRKEIIVAHAAFGYLAHQYGLEQIAIAGLSPQEEPSAAKMAEISKFAKGHDVKVIFFETLTSPKLAQVLAQEAGAQTAVLNPLEGLTQEEMKAGKDYIAVMLENLAAIKNALGE